MKNYDFANITVRPFLKLSDVNNPYIYGETKHVINMCDYREPEVIDLIHSKGGTFDWYCIIPSQRDRFAVGESQCFVE